MLSLMATSLIFTEILSSSAQREFEAVRQELDKPAPVQPDVRSELNRIATAIAPVAIDASLIPRNLLDRDRMERQLRGHLMNQLGYGWTVEAICYAGWCNITLKHAKGEIVVDADKGIPSKVVYPGERRSDEEMRVEAREHMIAIAENMKEIAVMTCDLDAAQAAKGRAELERAFAAFGSVEMLHEPGFFSITIKNEGGTIQAWALDGEGHTSVTTEGLDEL
jgi:hypothetical protein